jgi:hypothetical protein
MSIPSNARVCMVSLRGSNSHAAWCSNYEFEDVISGIDDVDMFSLKPGPRFELRRRIARSMIWKPGVKHLIPHFNPGLQSVKIDRDYDLFVFICMGPPDLIYLSAIEGWKERCKKKICFMVEFYSGWTKEYAYHLSLLRDFDHVTQCFSGSVAAVQDAVGKPCHHVPLGADVFRFTPHPNPVPRTIDVYSMGRRSEVVHNSLLKKAANRELFYIYDTIPGLLVQPKDHRQHRDLLANCAKRSRFFVAYPAKVDVAEETRGQSEVGARFYEGAATGALLLGQAPTIPSFAKEFHWPDAVVDAGKTEGDLDDVLATFRNDPARFERASRNNAINAMRHFDWAYRWKQMLGIVGLEPSKKLQERTQSLQTLAALAEKAAAA